MNKQTLISWHFATLALFSLIAYSNHRIQSNNCVASKYERILKDNREVNGIDVNLLEAIIQIESKGNFNAIGEAGEIGGMQIIPKYHRQRCKLANDADLFNPATNINCGAEILKHYLKVTNNNLKEALVMYNGGYAKPKQSYVYADKVLDLFTKL